MSRGDSLLHRVCKISTGIAINLPFCKKNKKPVPGQRDRLRQRIFGEKGSTEGVYVPFQLTLVVGRFVWVDDSFGSQTVQIGLEITKKLTSLFLIFGLAKPGDHRAHPAPVNAVARATLDVLPRSLGG